jgi:hypothetical protein
MTDELEQLRQALAERYRIVGELAAAAWRPYTARTTSGTIGRRAEQGEVPVQPFDRLTDQALAGHENFERDDAKTSATWS